MLAYDTNTAKLFLSINKGTVILFSLLKKQPSIFSISQMRESGIGVRARGYKPLFILQNLFIDLLNVLTSSDKLYDCY